MIFPDLRRFLLPALGAALMSMAVAACSPAPPPWQLNDVRGHLPDLQFQLTSDSGKPMTASDFRGRYVMMYFGYTHCPDVCPLTLVHLHLVMQKLGKDADKVHILFVSVDPARDTPQVLHQYVTAFDPRITGLTGTVAQITAMAKRYRSAFNLDEKQANGNYTVSHGSIIYVFDRHGRARLLGNSSDKPDEFVHDLKLLIRQD
jgi:protein SCO1/2